MFEKDIKAKADDTSLVPAATDTSETDTGLNGIGATPIDLARLGLNEIAYIRQAIVNDEEVWAIFNASGEPIGAAQTFDQAWGAVRQHDMEPARVH
ncbi:MAG: DUF1150 family protein [Rhodospirillaceae bacterium]|nr:DUF1150 family protein [Rhodospirillaceae bacterium]